MPTPHTADIHQAIARGLHDELTPPPNTVLNLKTPQTPTDHWHLAVEQDIHSGWTATHATIHLKTDHIQFTDHTTTTAHGPHTTQHRYENPQLTQQLQNHLNQLHIPQDLGDHPYR